jgi:hypothetical protein
MRLTNGALNPGIIRSYSFPAFRILPAPKEHIKDKTPLAIDVIVASTYVLPK